MLHEITDTCGEEKSQNGRTIQFGSNQIDLDWTISLQPGIQYNTFDMWQLTAIAASTLHANYHPANKMRSSFHVATRNGIGEVWKLAIIFVPPICTSIPC